MIDILITGIAGLVAGLIVIFIMHLLQAPDWLCPAAGFCVMVVIINHLGLI